MSRDVSHSRGDDARIKGAPACFVFDVQIGYAAPMRFFLLYLGLCALVLVSCGPTSTLCADTCLGCCDVTGQCQFGNTVSACGLKGSTCSACAGSQSCSVGACLSPGAGSTDAGRVTTDSGVLPSVDAGGSSGADSGTSESADSGAQGHDSGVQDNDSGVPLTDSGVQTSDSGVPPNDSGVPVDSGVQVDSGVATDAGRADAGVPSDIASARAADFPAYVSLKGVVVSAVYFAAPSQSTGDDCADTGTKGVNASFWVVDPSHPKDGLFVTKFRCDVPSDYSPTVGDVLDLTGYVGREVPYADREAFRVELKDQYDFLVTKPATCTLQSTPPCTPLAIVKQGTASPPTGYPAFSVLGELQARPDLLGARITLSGALYISSATPLALKRTSALPNDQHYYGFQLPTGALINDSHTRALGCDYRAQALDGGGLVTFTSITGVWDTYSNAPCADGGVAGICFRNAGFVPGTDAGYTHVLYPITCADYVSP